MHRRQRYAFHNRNGAGGGARNDRDRLEAADDSTSHRRRPAQREVTAAESRARPEATDIAPVTEHHTAIRAEPTTMRPRIAPAAVAATPYTRE